MANQKPSKPDSNVTVAVLVRKTTGAESVRGEDLLGSTKLKAAYLAGKERLLKKKKT